MESESEYYVQLKKILQNSSVTGLGGLSQKPNVKMSRNCLIFPVMYSMSNIKSQTGGLWLRFLKKKFDISRLKHNAVKYEVTRSSKFLKTYIL